jgi:signal transduction histidine kinase
MALGLARRDAEDHAPKQFARMQREIDNIAQLVGELLTLASLDDGVVKPLDETVDLGQTIAEVLANIAYETPERAADLIFRAPDQPIIVQGDAALLGRAVENVLRNAVFYTAPAASIEVVCETLNADRARITIRDQGPGVPEPALAHLFDPFYRVDDARARRTGGTGIGLAICRRAILLHHGNVTAHNLTPHGLAIVMDLPQACTIVGGDAQSTQLHNSCG